MKKLISKKILVNYQKTEKGVAWLMEGEQLTIISGDFDINKEDYQTKKALSGTQIKKLDLDNLSISDGYLISGKVKLKLEKSGGIKSMPQIDSEHEVITHGQLPKSIQDFKDFTGTGSGRPELTGICFSKESLVVATDAYRMLYRKHTASLKKDYILQKDIATALSVLPKPTLYLMDTHCCVVSGNIKVYSNNIKGLYGNYNATIPETTENIFTGRIDLENVNLIVDPATNLIVFHGNSVHTRDGSVEALKNGKWLADYPVGVNLKQLKKCLKTSGKDITVSCQGYGKPLVINDEILLMPIRPEKGASEIWETVNKI